MSLTDLASLNSRLITQTSASESAVSQYVDQTQPEGADIPVDTGADEFKGFSTANKLEFERVVNWVIDNIFGGTATGKTTLIDAFVNNWGEEWRKSQGLDPVEDILKTPSLEDLVNNPDFLNGAVWLPLTMTGKVPPVFESTTADENGVETPAIATADPMKGIQFITTPKELKELPPQSLFKIVRSTGTDLIRRVMTGGTGGVGTQDETAQAAANQVTSPQVNPSTGFVTGTTTQLDLPDYVKTAIVYSDPAAEGRVPRQPLPKITQTELIDALVGNQTTGGGGGGGGGGRDFVVDENQLRANIESKWARWLREDPNMDRVNQMVDQYVREAGAFWRDKGGKLDFDTFVNDKLEAQPRYQLLYRDKPADQTVDEYVSRFEAPIAQLGLRPELASDSTTGAILSRGSPAGQLERISRSRDAELLGGFSTRLAQTLKGLGI